LSRVRFSAVGDQHDLARDGSTRGDNRDHRGRGGCMEKAGVVLRKA